MKKRNKQLVLGLGAVSVLGVGLALANTPPATLYQTRLLQPCMGRRPVK